MSITEKLSDFVATLSLDDLPPEVLHAAKKCILDTIGCGIAGTTTAEGLAVISGTGRLDEGKSATIWGHGSRMSVANAALVNGVAAHALELDDWWGNLHAGSVVIPSVMAVAELEGSTGEEILTSVVVGYEIAARISLGGGIDTHYVRGWHPTGTCGTFGAAAATGKLLRLDKKRLSWALGLAGTYTGGIWAFLADGAMSKRLHPGKAAHSGILASYLAKQGFTGPTKILEADFGGFYATYVPGSYDLNCVTDNLGKNFAILENHFKLYPSCASTHGAIEAAIELRKHFSIDEMERAIVRVSDVVEKLCGGKEIRTTLDAQMSIPYAVSAVFLSRQASLSEYSLEAIHGKRVREIIRKVDVVGDSKTEGTTTSVEVTTKKGDSYQTTIEEPKGGPKNPLSLDEIRRKFFGLAVPVVGDAKAESILNEVENLENRQNVRELCGNLARS